MTDLFDPRGRSVYPRDGGVRVLYNRPYRSAFDGRAWDEDEAWQHLQDNLPPGTTADGWTSIVSETLWVWFWKPKEPTT